jgi:hypothetical protein
MLGLCACGVWMCLCHVRAQARRTLCRHQHDVGFSGKADGVSPPGEPPQLAVAIRPTHIISAAAFQRNIVSPKPSSRRLGEDFAFACDLIARQALSLVISLQCVAIRQVGTQAKPRSGDVQHARLACEEGPSTRLQIELDLVKCWAWRKLRTDVSFVAIRAAPLHLSSLWLTTRGPAEL